MALTATDRAAPAGLPLRDGFATMITFGVTGDGFADLSIWEKETTPPGKDGGDGINTTTFHNTRVTKWPRSLIEDTDISGVCAYDPNVETDLESIINRNLNITVTWNDGSTKVLWGFLKEFTPQSHTDGDMPEANFVVVVTNTDDSFLEDPPAVVSVPGS